MHFVAVWELSTDLADVQALGDMLIEFVVEVRTSASAMKWHYLFVRGKGELAVGLFDT